MSTENLRKLLDNQAIQICLHDTHGIGTAVDGIAAPALQHPGPIEMLEPAQEPKTRDPVFKWKPNIDGVPPIDSEGGTAD